MKLQAENHARRLKDGSVLRFYECVCEYSKVQLIRNPGVHDRRLKDFKREKCTILYANKDRALAVAAFNAELARIFHRKEVGGTAGRRVILCSDSFNGEFRRCQIVPVSRCCLEG